MGKPDGHSEYCGVDPAGLREEGKPYLRRSPFWSAHTGLPRQQCRGVAGVKQTLDVLDAAGLGHAGSARTQQEADTPPIYDVKGIKDKIRINKSGCLDACERGCTVVVYPEVHNK